MKRTATYGLLAEFDSPTSLVKAAEQTRDAGYKKIDAYSPLPVEGLAEAIGFHHDLVPLVTLIGAIIGGATGYLMPPFQGLVTEEQLNALVAYVKSLGQPSPGAAGTATASGNVGTESQEQKVQP